MRVFLERESMSVRRVVPIALAMIASAATGLGAQVPASPPPIPPLTMADAVRLSLEHNQTLRAQRLGIDLSKADEVTAGLKPNPSLSFGVDGLTVFSPKQMNWGFFRDSAQYAAGLDYTFERGGKREKRILTAQDTTDVTSKSVADAERQLRFQAAQAFVNVQLAKTSLDLAQQNLKSFSDTVDIGRARVAAGDMAEGDFAQLSLQKLQFETDLSAAELSIIQSKAQLRQLMGYDTIPDEFDVAGDLTHAKIALTLDDLKQQALTARPDFLSAQSSTKLAQDQVDLEISNRARDIDGNVGYSRNAFGPVSAIGVGVAFDLQIHDKNQGNIAHARIAVDQARETESAARATVLTDVATAFAEYQTDEKILNLYESGYLDQAKQSLDIATFVFQQGAGSLLTLLDAERTYRSTQLAYRQALAAYVTSLFQLNFVVGRQVIP
jgi:cobalt-zinc-cadmium efflux system outer membrane protein